MSHFSAVRLLIPLKADLPQEIKSILEYMIDEEEDYAGTLPDHPIFQQERWYSLVERNFESFKILVDNDGAVIDDVQGYVRFVQKPDGTYLLDSATNVNVKRAYNERVAMFLSWLMPYIEQQSDTAIAVAMTCSDQAVYYHGQGDSYGTDVFFVADDQVFVERRNIDPGETALCKIPTIQRGERDE